MKSESPSPTREMERVGTNAIKIMCSPGRLRILDWIGENESATTWPVHRGLGKMLADGIELKRALYVAGGCMATPSNRRFAEHVTRALPAGEDLSVREFSCSLPPFYLTILQCGLLTGRLPQALASAA